MSREIAVGVPMYSRVEALRQLLESVPNYVSTVYIAESGPQQDRGRPFYKHISELKDDVITSQGWDADALGEEGESEQLDPEEVERREAIRYAIRLYKPWDEDNDTTYKDVADVIPRRRVGLADRGRHRAVRGA